MNFREILVKALIFFIPISSYLVFTSIQGSTPAALLIATIFILSFFYDRNLIRKAIQFSVIFWLYYLFSQFVLYVYDGYNLNLLNYNIYIDGYNFSDSISVSESKDYIFRGTALTQFLYLFNGYFCFIFFKEHFNKKYNRIIFISSYVLFLYGIYLFAYFLMFGECFDPLSNRIFKEITQLNGCSYGYQTINLFGTEFHRVKSFTSEPSMYVLTAFPYVIFAFFNKKYGLCLIGIISLMLTFSTTFYLIFFIIILLISLRKYNIIITIFIFILITMSGLMISLIYPEIFDSVIYGKLSLSTLSGVQRFSSSWASLQLFESLSFPSQIVGVGFGTIRSSEIFSTFLVNVGVLGAVVYLFLFLRPIFSRSPSFQFEALRFCVASELLVLLIAVPEFSYLSSWFFLGIAYYFMNNNEFSCRG